MEAVTNKSSLKERLFSIVSPELARTRDLEGVTKSAAVFTGVGLSLFMLY